MKCRRKEDFSGLLNISTSLVVVFTVYSFSVCGEIRDESWHIGCYQMTNDDFTAYNISTELHAEGNPVACCRMCLNNGFLFSAVQQSDCFCLTNVSKETTELPQESCNITCSYNVSDVVTSQDNDPAQVFVMPCGGGTASTVSMYRTSGPFLMSLSLSVADDTIYIGQAFVITIDVSFSASPGMELNFGSSVTISRALVYIQSFCGVVQSQTLQANSRTLSTDIICILEVEGNYTANVTASNVLSELCVNISFIVLDPTISAVQVFLLSDQTPMPSCVPEMELLNLPEMELPNGTQQMVFEGVAVRFEASAVHVCCESIVFNWTFKDAGDRSTFSTLQDGIACRDGQRCSVSIQEYIFPSNGSYSVIVTASNNRSEASDRIELVVVTPGIRSVSFNAISSAVPVGEEVSFNMSVVTVIVQRVSLIVDFGDGGKRRLGFHNIDKFQEGVSSTVSPANPDDFDYTPQELTTSESTTVTSSASIPDWEVLEMMGSFRFTEDCEILLTLKHVYLQEGLYFPALLASDGFSNISVSVDKSVVVFNTLQSVTINHSLVDSVNESVIFTAEPNIPSIFFSFHWLIYFGDQLMFENVMRSSVLRYVFSDAGLYDVVVNTSNPSDFRINSSHIIIEVPIEKLEIECSPESFVGLYQILNCSASANIGTDIGFQWNFHDDLNSWISVWSLDHYSNAHHRFHSVGEYAVSVQASNRLSQLSVSLPYKVIVLEPVYNLWTLVPRPVLLGEVVGFVARIGSGGSDVVSVRFHFGDSSDVVIVNATHGVNVTLSHVYNRVGTYHVKVFARNEVSVLKREFDVDIVEDFSVVSVSLVGPRPVTGIRSAFVAYVDRTLSDREDLLYNWTKDGEFLNTTQSPVYGLVFDSVALFNISVTVYNMIVTKSDWMVVNVTDDPLTFFIGFDQISVAFGYASALNLVNTTCGKLTIDYGDNSTGKEINSTDLELRLEHFYNEPGAYIVVATCDDVVAMTAVTVQQVITSVILTGPEVLLMSRLEELWKWHAVASNGSSVVYQWKLDDVPVAVTAKNKVYLAPPFGQHVVTVLASNGLGSVSTNVSFLVQGPIISVAMTISDVVLGTDAMALVSVIGDGKYNVTCYFGDGAVIANSSKSFLLSNLHGLSNEEFSTDSLVLSHKYSSAGVYSVLINVTNHVSWRTANSTVRVYEPIGEILLQSSSPSIVESDSVVMVTAVTIANYTLSFSWNSQGSICLSSSNFDGNIWKSTANCSLSPVVGMQIVIVNVSSAVVADNWRLANMTFMVIDPIDKLVLLTSPTNPTEAAVLRENSTYPGNFYTDPIKFEARMDRGSEVVCKFDFGDNSTSLQSALSEVSGPTSCFTAHVFRKAGIYNVSVTASNQISSLSSEITFYVQVQPSGLRLSKDSDPYRTQIGLPVVFIVNISYGTNVSYTWTMGDGQVYSPAGQNVTHRYSALGCFYVNVVAFNKVGSTNAPQGNVYVQDSIQSVELVTNIHPSQTGIVVRNGASVLFTANPRPDVRCLVDAYEWKPLKDQKDARNVVFSYLTIVPHYNYTYNKLGTFSATVTARNALGSLTSEPLIVSVMDELKTVTIEIRGEMVINNQIEFFAYHFAGSSVTYLWNFGDNSTAVSTVAIIKHSYSSGGVFTVSVNASNPISQEMSSEIIFVTKTFCRPPAIQFLGSNNIIYWRSEDIRVEARVDINCSITNNTAYDWTVTDTDSGLRISVESFGLHDPLLYLPRQTLSNGNYSVQLRVTMTDTIVYGESKTVSSFSVISSPLQAVIHGGLMRNVSYGQNIILDGSQSYDPDSPDNTDFIFSWSCLDFFNRDKPCFTDTRLSTDIGNYSNRLLNISGSAFRSDTTYFLIQLNVSKPSHENSSVQQMLTFQERPTIQVSIACEDCADHVVNSNDQLVFEAMHFGFEESGLNYTWTLSDIKVTESNSPASASYQDSCFPVDGTIFGIHFNGSTHNSSQLASSEPTFNASQIEADDPVSDNSRQSNADRSIGSAPSDVTSTAPPGGEADFVSSTTPRASTSLVPGAVPGPPRITADESIQHGGRNSNRRLPHLPPMVSSNHGIKQQLPSTVVPSVPSYSVQPSIPDFGNNIEEGAGNAPPVFPSPIEPQEQQSEGRGKPPRSKGQKNLPGSKLPTDSVIDQTDIYRKPEGIFMAERNERKLLSYETTTGINQKVLIINSNVLNQGVRYVIEVTVVNKWSNLTGTSMIDFCVNRSPGLGNCRMKPDSVNGATEMQTEFSVYCIEWKDESCFKISKSKPIVYEVNYRLSVESQPNLIYRGLSSEIKFQLPAGNPDNYTVMVEIAVIDSLGARSTVCVSPVIVYPSITNVQAMLSEVEGNGTVAVYIQKGRNVQARLSAFMIARQLNRQLNRQPSANNVTDNKLRISIRTELLSYIENLPIRDMFEVQQTVLVLAEITRHIREIDEEGANYSRSIIQRLGSIMVQAQAEVTGTDTRFAELAIEGASNLIDWLLVKRTPSYPQSFGNNFLSDMMDCMKTLLLIKSHALLPSVESMDQSTNAMSTVTARFGLNTNPEIVLNSARLKFPFLDYFSDVIYGSKMPNELLKMCFKSNIIFYKSNPFIFGSQPDGFIATSVVSVTMYTCNGSQLNIADLTKDQSFDVTLPNQMYNHVGATANASLPVYQLNREYMNVHNFSVNFSNYQEQNLHIDIQFLPLPSSVSFFPVKAYVQVNSDPSPWCKIDSYPSPLNCFEFDIPNPNVTSPFVIDLTDLKIEGCSVFSLSLVEHTLNAVRPRPTQAESLSYRVSIWWGRCLYWDDSTGDWSSTGCSLADSSLFSNIRCRFNHLTSFGANVFVFPSSFKQLAISQFFSLPMSPVTCSVVPSLLLFYFILLFIAFKLDAHDNRKLPVISLVDNSSKDNQKYFITLETGFRRGAGTSAKVSVVLHGEYGMCETRELISQTGQPLFERNSRDTFYMTLPESLGSIFKVQLWHDNSGPFPSWYLSRVTVKDACTGDIYYFVCEKWFAVEKEDGKVEREVMVADKGLSFSKILLAKSMQYLTDYHLWFSTLVKPSYSRFTRAQRLTCCLCLLMSSMALSTAWYQYIGPPYRGEFNLIDISWQSIIVGMIVGLVALPPTMIIILIFRRSKVYRHNFEETSEEYEGNELCLRDQLLSDHAGNGLSVFEQTILSWQSLQEWAQKAPAKHYQQSPVGSVQNVKPVAVQNFVQDHSSTVDGEPVVAGKQRSDITNSSLHKCGTILEVGNVSDVPTVVDADPKCRELLGGAVEELSGALRNQDLRENDVIENKSICQPINFSNVMVEKGMEPTFNRQEAKRMGFRKRIAKGSSCNTSPSSSCFDSSPKEVRRVTLEGSSEGGDSRSLPAAPLQPPSYGVIFQSPGAPSRSCSQGSSSNRSSVKSASSSCTKQTTLKKFRLFLPHYFVYVGWTLCTLLIAGCSFVTIYYGFRFSQAQSIVWLQSVFFGFLQCIFVSHPIIVVAIVLYTAVRYRNDMRIFDHYSDGLIHDRSAAQAKGKKEKKQSSADKQLVEQKSMSLEEGIAARQRSRYLRFARPPQEQRLIQARHQTMKERNASALVNESVLFVGQFLLLVFIAFGKETETSYQLKASLTKSYVSNGDNAFENVTSIGQWWHWINNHFLDVMFSEEGYVDNCYLIGRVSLRQLRIKDVECYIDSMSNFNFRCRDVYNQAPHATEVIMKNGVKYEYTSADKSNSYTLNGLFGSYGGGGYIVYLDKEDRFKTEHLLHQLQQSNWTDQHTSAVILQFTLFHPQTNLFATVSLILELPPLGSAFASNYVSIVYLYKYITTMDNLVLACELLFFMATLLKIHHEIVQVLRHGINYLKNIWNALEVSQCLLSLALIVCYTYRFLLIDSLVEKFRSAHLEEFVDVSNLAYWDMVLRSLTGFVLLLVNLQLVKGLRHHQPFARFANVYNHTSLDFVVFGCMFVIWLGAFISLGIALFGGVLLEMTSVSQALGYMTGLLECSYEFPLFKGLSPSELAIWEVYTMSFLILAYGTNAGYLLAFLTFHYRVFKDEPVLVFSPRENLAYYCQKVLDFFKGKPDNAYDIGKQQEIVLPPEFTMAEIQYQVDEMLFKMNALAGTSNLPEKPAMYFTDSDTTCIGNGEELSSSGGSSGEGNFENWLHRMKDNLFRNDSHFAQLVNCPSQTSKQETNKQLMLQLEMEILRQLQGKRSSSNHPSESGGNNGRDGMKREGGEAANVPRPYTCQNSSSSSSSSKASASPLACLRNRQLPLPTAEPYHGNQLERVTASDTVRVAKELNALSSSKVCNDPCVELNVMSQCYNLKDKCNDNSGERIHVSSSDTMETEFGNDINKQLLVPDRVEDSGRQPVDSRTKWKLGKVPSWTSSGSKSTDSADPSPTDGSTNAKDIFPSLHLPLQMSHLPDDSEVVDDVFRLVAEDEFCFENEGFAVESSGEDSDQV